VATRTDHAHRDAAVEVELFGGFRLVRSQHQVHVPGHAQRVVAFLALRSPATRAKVAGSLWPEVDDRRAHGSLRTSIWHLHHRCPELLSTHGGSLSLSKDVHVDVIDFEGLVRQVFEEPHDVPLADLAQDVIRRELLPGWYDEWVLVERERFHQRQLHVLEAVGDELLFRRKPGPALDAALAAVQAEPLRESARRLVIRVHLAEGNVCEAIRHYLQYLRLLRDELGVAPTEQLTQLVAGLPMPGSMNETGALSVTDDPR
jgi:DNA-binding SARP family transcriptional activator